MASTSHSVEEKKILHQSLYLSSLQKVMVSVMNETFL